MVGRLLHAYEQIKRGFYHDAANTLRRLSVDLSAEKQHILAAQMSDLAAGLSVQDEQLKQAFVPFALKRIRELLKSRGVQISEED